MVLCATTPPETAYVAKTLWFLGCTIGSIAYGILLVLAYSCIQSLHRRSDGGGRSDINKGLTIYVLLVVVIATSLEVLGIQHTLYGVLDETCVGPYLHVFQPFLGPSDLVSFLMTLLTDSLLVSHI